MDSKVHEYHRDVAKVANLITNSSHYNPCIFPLDSKSMPLNVTVSVIIYKLLALTNDKALSVALVMDLSWFDPNIPGDWSLLGNQGSLNLPTYQVWTMNLYLLNPATSYMYVQPSSPVYVSKASGSKTGSSGGGADVRERIVTERSSVCETMSLVDFPFDSQKCTMQLEYKDGGVVSLQGTQLARSLWADNGEWQLTEIRWRETGNPASFAVQFQVTRNSFYYVVFLIVPTVLLEVITMLTFVLPSDEGEKVVLGATLVLAVNFLMTSLNQLIPQMEQDSVPKIVIAIRVGFIMTALSLFEAVLMQTVRIMASDVPLVCTKFIDRHCCKPHEQLLESDCATNFTNGQLNMSDFEAARRSAASNREGGRKNGRYSAAAIVMHDMKLQAVNAAVFTNNGLFLHRLVETRKNKEIQLELVKSAWRKVEYSVNVVTLLAYAAVTVYYFGVYIFIA